MRFLTLKKTAQVTLKSETSGPTDTAALAVQRDTGVSVVAILGVMASSTSPKKPMYFLHYVHRCGGRDRQDLWLRERDLPNGDGDHFVCPVCRLVGLRVSTVPQQPAVILIGGTNWPP